MSWETILKDSDPAVPPRLRDYDRTRSAFTWSQARDALAGLPGGGLNIAYEAVDRHAASGNAGRAALRCVARDNSVATVSYAELARRTARFANVLRSLGVGRGDRVYTLLGRCPELYTAVLGALKNTSVVCPLFSAFGPDPVEQRLRLGDARVLVTTADLYRRKVAGRRASVPGLEHVLIVGPGAAELPGTASLKALMSTVPGAFAIPPTSPDDMALLHFTSGTTGTPKGAVHVHEAVVAHYATAAHALDLHPEDVYWCTADPGWVTGMSYGVIAPLVHGVTVVVDEGDYDARRWYRILAGERVSVWYTAPTALRMVMRATPRHGPYDLPRSHDLSALRFIASVGEPLNPEAVVWGRDVLGLPVHDNWWQTETGCIMIANFAACEIRPGSMGRPLPGVESGVLERGRGRQGSGRRRQGEGGGGPRRGGRAGAAAGVAVDVPRLSARQGTLRRGLRGRLVPDRRSGAAGRGRLVLVRGTRRRRDQVSLGADMEEGTLLEWLVQPGDTVRKGDPVAVVETAKSTIEVECFETGTMTEVLVPPGTTVPVGTPLAVIGTPEKAGTEGPGRGAARGGARKGEPAEPAPPPAPPPPPPSPAPGPAPAHRVPAAAPGAVPHADHVEAGPLARHLAEHSGLDLETVRGTGPGGRVTRTDVEKAAARPPRTRATPFARRLAAELGVDLATVVGTGRDAAVRAADVRRAAAAPAAPARADVRPLPPRGAAAPPPDDRVATMRRAIAGLMSRAREIPHYYLSTTVDMAAQTEWLLRYNRRVPVGERLLPAALLLKAAALAAREVPELNGFWTDDRFRAGEGVHLGVAVSLRGGGLVTPTLRGADTLALPDLMAALKDMVTRARRGRLRGTEVSDPTITVTHLGDQGVESVFGVIHQPQVALVGFGRVVDRPWAVDGLLGVRPVVTATLSADHRATDGADGARYLTAVTRLLQHPEEL